MTSDLEMLVQRAQGLATQQDWSDSAAEVNRQIIEIDAGNVPAYTRLARYFLLGGNLDEAGALYARVLELQPDNRIAHNGLLNVQDALNVKIEKQVHHQVKANGKRRGTSVSYPDGEDDDAVRTYFETTYPDKGDRVAALTMAAETIRAIDAANSASLGLTVRSKWSRLNVGGVGWGFFNPGGIMLIVETAAIEALSPQEAKVISVYGAGYQHVKDLPTRDIVLVAIPLSHAESIYPRLAPSHLRIVGMLARQIKRTPYYRSHTPAAIRYMREQLGEDVPHPLH